MKKTAGPTKGKTGKRTAASPSDRPGLTRKERALETRRRMLSAAYRLFGEHGYGPTTMDAIASEAGVAVQTLYFTFNTKGALLGELLGAAILGIERWPGPPREPLDAGDPQTLGVMHQWFAALDAEPDARRALAIFARSSVAIFARTTPLLAAIYAASADPDVRAVRELSEQRRVDSFRAIVRMLARKEGGLRRGLGVKRATDILLVLLSEGTHRELATRGWSTAQCERWLVEVLSEQLLGARAGSSTGYPLERPPAPTGRPL